MSIVAFPANPKQTFCPVIDASKPRTMDIGNWMSIVLCLGIAYGRWAWPSVKHGGRAAGQRPHGLFRQNTTVDTFVHLGTTRGWVTPLCLTHQVSCSLFLRPASPLFVPVDSFRQDTSVALTIFSRPRSI